MSYTHLLYHIVFRPKNNAPVIKIEHEEHLYRYIWGFIKQKNCVLYRIGGMPDHIHMFVQLPPTYAVSDFMRDIKTATNMYMKSNTDLFPRFNGWAKAYCALSYSWLEKDKIINYIKNQKEHHKRVSFRDELLTLLREFGVEVNKIGRAHV